MDSPFDPCFFLVVEFQLTWPQQVCLGDHRVTGERQVGAVYPNRREILEKINSFLEKQVRKQHCLFFLFFILFQILFLLRLLQNIEQSSLSSAVGPCWLSI